MRWIIFCNDDFICSFPTFEQALRCLQVRLENADIQTIGSYRLFKGENVPVEVVTSPAGVKVRPC